MKIVQINTFPYKSTGNIMLSIQRKLLAENVECYSIWGRGRKSENKYEIFMNDKNGVRFHGLYSRLLDKTGFASVRATKKLIKKIKEIDPDIIHLRDIHIGKNSFIGANAMILYGSRIGENVIIGAGAVVKGNIPDNSIVAGNPGKIVGNTIDWAHKHLELEDYTYLG